MTSNRPYLVRAIYEWIVDNGFTPHLVVDAAGKSVQVPSSHVNDGQIILNVAPSAVRDLELGNEWISFSARFGGKPTNVLLPPSAVLAIYARENGQGMAFPDDQPGDEPPPEPEAPPPGKPSLRVVK